MLVKFYCMIFIEKGRGNSVCWRGKCLGCFTRFASKHTAVTAPFLLITQTEFRIHHKTFDSIQVKLVKKETDLNIGLFVGPKDQLPLTDSLPLIDTVSTVNICVLPLNCACFVSFWIPVIITSVNVSWLLLDQATKYMKFPYTQNHWSVNLGMTSPWLCVLMDTIISLKICERDLKGLFYFGRNTPSQ